MPRPKMTYRDRRRKAYEKELPLADQLDAVLKAFDMVLQDGGELPYELIDVIEKWQEIKNRYPKEEPCSLRISSGILMQEQRYQKITLFLFGISAES